MSICYDKVFKLMELRGFNKNYLRKNGLYAATVDKLIKGGTVDTDTINKLCRILDCQPGDILEYVPDDMPERDKED